MDEWNFKRVGIEDQKLIEEYFRKYPERSCDRTFFGVLLWGRHYNLKFADTGKALLFREYCHYFFQHRQNWGIDCFFY